MTAPAPQSQPEGEYANWTLHRQPADQMIDHRFSLWSGEHPVVLANEAVGEDGVLAFIVSELNSVATLQAQVEELTKALERARISLNAVAVTTDSVSFHADVEAIDRALAPSLEQSGRGK